ENGIEHRLTKIKHPWTNGQVERMNRTIKEATVQRYHYDRHDQLQAHLADFINAYNYARRLKTLKGLTPYEYICKCWTSQPERFKLNPLQQMPGLNTDTAMRTMPIVAVMNRTVLTWNAIWWAATAVVLIAPIKSAAAEENPDSIRMAMEIGVPTTISCRINAQSKRQRSASTW
ncbi:integrase core domain-containing protein, partial [Bradyrhizobium sp. Tv2a-2]|uniref:integrase core domain-containing protein n=1 Tax=Bradyrhizobium sp. Tv2a-2 TaxID=113395 RepID=UPI001FD9961A